MARNEKAIQKIKKTHGKSVSGKMKEYYVCDSYVVQAYIDIVRYWNRQKRKASFRDINLRNTSFDVQRTTGCLYDGRNLTGTKKHNLIPMLDVDDMWLHDKHELGVF